MYSVYHVTLTFTLDSKDFPVCVLEMISPGVITEFLATLLITTLLASYQLAVDTDMAKVETNLAITRSL